MIIKKAIVKIVGILMCFIFGFLIIGSIYNLSDTEQCLNCCNKLVQDEIQAKDDFYVFVNQEWFKNNKLSKGCSSYGTFQEISNKVDLNIINIVDTLEKNKNNYCASDNEMKVINLYEQYLDMNKRNEIGIEPIKKYISLVEQIKNINDLKSVLLNEEFSYFQTLINLGVGADYKNNDKNILYIGESSLTLGNSCYYKHDDMKELYIDYLTQLNELSGLNKKQSKEFAEVFYSIEKSISQNILSKEESAVEKNKFENKYNIYSMSELEDIFPNIHFKDMLKKYNLDKAKKIVVENPSNIKEVNNFLTLDNLDKIKIYLRTSILLKADDYLDESFRSASKKIKKQIYGSDLCKVNKEGAIKFVNNCVPEIISKLYIESCFDYNSKYDVEKIINKIIGKFKTRLEKNEWLSQETRKCAINKLNHINIKVGYPQTWDDYSDMEIISYNQGGNIIDNLIKIYVYEMKIQFSQINNNTNKDKWNMPAFAVNAYYNPINNEIVFPAGILQFPFYNKRNSIEENLGAIGVIIGHELTHAFDNSGCQFDSKGNLKNWWTQKDYKEFEKRSNKIAEYYSRITTKNGKLLNGNLIVEENISDLGGMSCALDLMAELEKPNYKKFFESYARMWREVSTNEMKEFLIANDCHAPKDIRVNQIVSQFDEFYKEYSVKEGDNMFVKKEERIEMW